MKTIFTSLFWISVLSSLSILMGGVLIPLWVGEGASDYLSEQVLFINIPVCLTFVFLTIYFQVKREKLEWENDFFYLLFKFSSLKGKQVKKSLQDEVDKAKNKIKENIDHSEK
jgi:hypothetical protein|tara:strand:- start:83 stop:421 length:339 start_codon:yes stop_codon:yes gene_type:complete